MPTLFSLFRKLCFIYIGGTCISMVQATVLTENLALNKQSYLSDTDGVYAAHLANDGNLANGFCSKTLSNDGHWEVDLGDTYLIGQIKVYNTDESCCSGNLKSVTFFTGETRDSYIYHVMTTGPAALVYTWTLNIIVYARWIKISRKLGQRKPMTICEVEVFEGVLGSTTGTPTTTSGSGATSIPGHSTNTTGSATTSIPGHSTTTLGSGTTSISGHSTNTTGSATTSNPLKMQLFSMNNQKRAAGEVTHITLAKSEKHCCFMCLATMTTNECESVNYDKVTGECSLVKGLTTEDDADDDTVMMTPDTS